MAAQAVFVFCLVTRIVTVVTFATVSATSGEVIVYRGEQLQISCDGWYEDGTEFIRVRWYRQADPITYGEIDVSTSCANMTVCEAHTADNRGKIRYERSSRNEATLTLAIGTSTLEDNRTFICGFFSRRGVDSPIFNTATISVSVNYPKDEINPVCDVSSPTVLTCSFEITQPVVSLEWTTLVNSSKISLSNDTIIVGNQVKNILHLDALEIPYDGTIFTCYLTTEASPVFKGNCSIGPITTSSTSTTGDTQSTEASISTTREIETLSTAPSNPTTVDAGASQTSQTRITSQGKTQSWPSTPDIIASETTQDTELSFTRPDSTPGITATKPTQDTEVSFSRTDSLSTIRLSTFATIPVKVSILIAVAATCATIFIVLFLLVAYLTASRRQFQKRFHQEQDKCNGYQHQLANVNPSATRSLDDHDLGQPQSISLHTLPGDTRDSTNSIHHSYETRIGWTVAELHPQEPDQRQQSNTPVTGPSVDRLRPKYTEDGYTQYIVEGNNGNQTTSNTDYMPLSAYEEVDNAAPCDYEHPNGQ